MAKKRGGRKMRQDDYDDDDAVSLASVETGRTMGSDDADFYDSYTKGDGDDEAIEEAIEELTEKRTTTRVAAMQKLHTHLLHYLPPESLSESFVSNILSCLRRPSEDEAVYGAKILAVMSIIIGEDDERFFQRGKNVLEPLAKTSRSQKVKAAAIRALAMTCFICGVEEENSDELMEIFEKYLEIGIVGGICASALEGWGLLASALPDEILSGDSFVNRFLPQFLILLDHSDVDVRSAAGENIALLFESAQKCGSSLPCDAEIIEKFRVMSKDSSKKNSKKDRKVQRSVFRDIHATLENGDSPQISFSVKNDQLEVSSWKSVLQFEAIKNCLNTGLQQHIKYNNPLRLLLDLPETLEDYGNDRRDVFDKKSSSRKQRSNELKDERRRKQNMQEAFLDDF
ncbi:hypothetical protein Poli38472_002274 [Pythium oligandrum]|uniref:Interferon-related developmental regulator N-terminal domain-containing protein n=1 Tax=Pythium oligandrum TaxID=41045 RepID=A0A8K1CI02_PYTOL|nr:hypothetical protein Poli38472_002274 [Pythium oligandrum]|eukprot:TMW63333.1 hypothetical protein Poli38472_002274 [Pythium oligandrum]